MAESLAALGEGRLHPLDGNVLGPRPAELRPAPRAAKPYGRLCPLDINDGECQPRPLPDSTRRRLDLADEEPGEGVLVVVAVAVTRE